MAMVKVVARMVARHRARQAARLKILEDSVQNALPQEVAKLRREDVVAACARAPGKGRSQSHGTHASIPMHDAADHHIGGTIENSTALSATAPSPAMHNMTSPAGSSKCIVAGALSSERQELRAEAVESISAQKGKAPSQRPRRKKGQGRRINTDGEATPAGALSPDPPQSSLSC